MNFKDDQTDCQFLAEIVANTFESLRALKVLRGKRA